MRNVFTNEPIGVHSTKKASFAELPSTDMNSSTQIQNLKKIGKQKNPKSNIFL